MMLFAQLAGGYSFIQLAIAVVVIVIVIGIVLIVMRVAGVTLPQWVWAIIGLIVLCVLAIAGIRIVAGS